MHTQSWLQFCREQLDGFHKMGRYRSLRLIESEQDTSVVLDGKEYLSFCSNNYLGLANNPMLKESVTEAVQRYGWGAGASRLISGNMKLHQELETEIARFKGAEASLLFPTGYMANLGAITALAGKGDAVVIDRMNHASIIDGSRQCGARLFVYEHRSSDDLRIVLKKAADRYKKILVITDSVFSMDGDIAPLPQLAEVVNEFDALLMIDEAHATGVLGEHGRGALEYFGLEEDNVGVVMGTLSKAIGSLGGFVAGSSLLIDYLRNTARSFIYTTALPPAVCAASLAGLRLVKQEDWRRRQLKENVVYIKKCLSDLGFNCDDTPVPIIPLIIGKEAQTIALSNYLFEHGILAPAIRPPTVPKGKCRLRLTVMATHTKEQFDKLIDILRRA